MDVQVIEPESLPSTDIWRDCCGTGSPEPLITFADNAEVEASRDVDRMAVSVELLTWLIDQPHVLAHPNARRAYEAMLFVRRACRDILAKMEERKEL